MRRDGNMRYVCSKCDTTLNVSKNKEDISTMLKGITTCIDQYTEAKDKNNVVINEINIDKDIINEAAKHAVEEAALKMKMSSRR